METSFSPSPRVVTVISFTANVIPKDEPNSYRRPVDQLTTSRPYLNTEPFLVVEVISLVFWIITVPLYTLLVYAMIDAQRKKIVLLTSSFYKLCIATGIVDIVTLLSNYFGSVFPKWGWFTSVYKALGKPYVYVFLIMSWGSGLNQALAVSVMTANRVSAILFPRKYDNLWCGCRLKTAIAMQTIPGYVLSLLAFSHDVKLIKIGRGGLVPGFKNPKVTKVYFMSAFIFLTANSIFLILSYCYLFYALRKKNNALFEINVKTTAQRDRAKVFAMRREFRLFMMASIIVAVQLIVLLFVLLQFIPWISFTINVWYILYNPLSNLYSGIGPYLLLIFSAELRQHFCRVLGIRKNITTPTAIVS